MGAILKRLEREFNFKFELYGTALPPHAMADFKLVMEGKITESQIKAAWANFLKRNGNKKKKEDLQATMF